MDDDTCGLIEIVCVDGSVVSFTGNYKDHKKFVVTALENPIVGTVQDNAGFAAALVVNNIVSIRFKADEA